MNQIIKMCSDTDLDSEQCVVAMTQIVKMCDGKDLEKRVMCGGNELDSANVWW